MIPRMDENPSLINESCQHIPLSFPFLTRRTAKKNTIAGIQNFRKPSGVVDVNINSLAIDFSHTKKPVQSLDENSAFVMWYIKNLDHNKTGGTKIPRTL